MLISSPCCSLVELCGLSPVADNCRSSQRCVIRQDVGVQHIDTSSKADEVATHPANAASHLVGPIALEESLRKSLPCERSARSARSVTSRRLANKAADPSVQAGEDDLVVDDVPEERPVVITHHSEVLLPVESRVARKIPEAVPADATSPEALRLHLAAEAPGLGEVPNDILRNISRFSNGDAAKASSRAMSVLQWRAQEQVDAILSDAAALAEERLWRKLLCYDLPGLDIQNRPLMLQSVGRWNLEEMSTAMQESPEALLRSQVVVYETLRQQACSTGSPAQQWVLVLDMSGLSVRHTWYPVIFSKLSQVGELSRKYYPESVERIFVVNAPVGFSAIWRVLERVVKPHTRSKVQVLPNGDYSALLQECGPDRIPKMLRGRLPDEQVPYFAGTAASVTSI